jgi:hypothetical protein
MAPLTGRTYDPISSALSHRAFAPFLPHVLGCHRGRQLLVIHDRGAPHQGASVAAGVREATGRRAAEGPARLVASAEPPRAPLEGVAPRRPPKHRCVTLQEPMKRSGTASVPSQAAPFGVDCSAAVSPWTLELHHCRAPISTRTRDFHSSWEMPSTSGRFTAAKPRTTVSMCTRSWPCCPWTSSSSTPRGARPSLVPRRPAQLVFEPGMPGSQRFSLVLHTAWG